MHSCLQLFKLNAPVDTNHSWTRFSKLSKPIGAHHFPLGSTISKLCSNARCIDFDITGFMTEMYLNDWSF